MQTLSNLFNINNLIPHGYCLSWNPPLLWLHVISDVLITLSYYSIPLSLAYFIRKRKDLPYAWLFTMGALFIVACGTTHLMSAVLIWIPLYWVDGFLKAFTAIISLATAIAMWWIIPLALQLPSAARLQNEINERKQAELAQQEALSRLNKIANQLPSLVFQFRMRPDGSVCLPYASEVLRKIYRIDPASVREDATAVFAVVHPDDLTNHLETIKTSAQELSPWHDEYRLKFVDGSECWLWGNALPEREEDGSVLWHGFVSDITERKQLELELQRSNAELEQFAYAVSHDMRQPLRMVTSYLSLIEKALANHLDEDTRQCLTFAIDGAKRMDGMILSLLDYSRVGRLTKPLTLVSSQKCVNEAVLFLQPELKNGTVSISGDWIELLANRDELTRLLQNLIGNALKYHDENKPSKIEVLATATEKWFRVDVRDNGIGIAANQIDRLFKVFSRLQARSRFEGTGIGLALCRKIVEHHGGKIGVISKGEGFGSTFWFELPLVQHSVSEQ